MTAVQKWHVHFGEFQQLVWSAARFARVDTLEHEFTVAARTNQCAAVVHVARVALSAAAHSCVRVVAVEIGLAFFVAQWGDGQRMWQCTGNVICCREVVREKSSVKYLLIRILINNCLKS